MQSCATILIWTSIQTQAWREWMEPSTMDVVKEEFAKLFYMAWHLIFPPPPEPMTVMGLCKQTLAMAMDYPLLATLVLIGVLTTWYLTLTLTSRVRKELLKRLSQWRLRRFLRRYEPESARPDSEYYRSPPPPFQFAVWTTAFSTPTLLGHGVRIGDWLVCPAHVVETELPMEVCSMKYDAHSRRVRIDVAVSSTKFKWEPVAADLVAARYDNRLQLKAASVGPYYGRPLVTIATAFPDANASCGTMKEDGFGLLEYNGSTRKGFSGAAYVCEGRLVGIHLGGGVQNLAYAASYVANLLWRPESSEGDAVRRALAGSDDWEVGMTGDPDRVQVRAKGRYYMLSRDEYEDVMAEYETDRQMDEIEGQTRGYQRYGRRRQRKLDARQTYHPESGNPSSPPIEGGLAGLASHLDLPTPLPQEPTTPCENYSMSQAMSSLADLQTQCSDLSECMISLRRQLAVLSRASKSNSERLPTSSIVTPRGSTIGQASTSTPRKETNGSDICSGPSTSKEQPDLGVSATASQSAMPSAGTRPASRSPTRRRSRSLKGKSTLGSELSREELRDTIAKYQREWCKRYPPTSNSS